MNIFLQAFGVVCSCNMERQLEGNLYCEAGISTSLGVDRIVNSLVLTIGINEAYTLRVLETVLTPSSDSIKSRLSGTSA